MFSLLFSLGAYGAKPGGGKLPYGTDISVYLCRALTIVNLQQFLMCHIMHILGYGGFGTGGAGLPGGLGGAGSKPGYPIGTGVCL